MALDKKKGDQNETTAARQRTTRNILTRGQQNTLTQDGRDRLNSWNKQKGINTRTGTMGNIFKSDFLLISGRASGSSLLLHESEKPLRAGKAIKLQLKKSPVTEKYL